MARQRTHIHRAPPSPQKNGRNGRPMFYGGPDPITLNRMEAMVNNLRTVSMEWERRRGGAGGIDPRRNIWEECGYPADNLSAEEYKDLVDWEPIAAVVNDIYPLESFQSIPEVYEIENGKIQSAWERAWYELPLRMGREESYFDAQYSCGLAPDLLCADIVSGISRYGVLLIGLNDQLDLEEPAFNDRWWEGQGASTASPNPKRDRYDPKRQVTFLRSFPEHLASIDAVVEDGRDRRAGWPEYYSITFHDWSESSGLSSIAESSRLSTRVHWTRVIHLADRWHTATSSPVYAIPRCKPVLHPILDIQKVRGGSAEMYWLAAFMGLHFGTHPQLGADVDVDVEGLKDMYEEWRNGLQRAIYTNGMFVDNLSPQSVDPKPFIEVHVDAIAIKTRTPKRILAGSERGELASGDDKKKWNNRLDSRNRLHVDPNLNQALPNRLVNLGVLPRPEQGLKVFRPDLSVLSEDERAKVLLTKTQAYAAYVQSGMNQMVPEFDYMTSFDDMDEDAAQVIIDRAGEAQLEAEEEAQALADEHGLEPAPPEGFQKPEPDPVELERAKAEARAKVGPTPNGEGG